MSAIKYIEDANGNKVFPITSESAVRDSQNIDLETKLAAIQNSIPTATSDLTNDSGFLTDDGNYENMRVGFADNLTPRGDATTETWKGTRTSGGDNSITDCAAEIKSIHGNSVFLHQYVRTSTMSTTSNNVTVVSNNDGIFTLSTTEDGASANTSSIVSTDYSRLRVDHKWLLLGCPQGGSTSTYHILAFGAYDTGNGAIFSFGTYGGTVNIVVKSGTILSEPLNFYPMLFDLSIMFGVGNEPTSVDAACKLIFGKSQSELTESDLIANSSAQMLNMKVSSLVTTYTNEDGESESKTISLPTLTYFPDGMKSAGSAYDEITPTKKIVRIGSVNLGTLNWVYVSGESRFYTTDLASLAKIPTTSSDGGNIYCTAYTVSNYDTQTQKSCFLSTTGSFSIIDILYSDVTVFKAAMSGRTLYYELATPVETTIDEDFGVYEVTTDGTEQAFARVDSSPFAASIAYSVDAVSTIKKLASANNSLLTALNAAGIGTFTYDESTGTWSFSS